MSDLILDGNSYVKFPQDERFYENKSLFVSLDLNLLDWNQDGSSQIIGNFNGQGWGMFYNKGFEDVLDYAIVDNGNNHLYYFNQDGGLVSQRNFPNSNSNFTITLVDHTDSKYFFDQANNTCIKFDNNNLFVSEFTIPSGIISVIVPDKEGNIYFMDIQNEVIRKYSSNGVHMVDSSPEYNKHNNMIVLTDGTIKTFFSRTNTPMLADSLENTYTLWGANIYRNGVPWFFVSPQSNTIGIDNEDNIWVVYNNNKLIKIDRNGKIIFNRLIHNIKPCEEAQCPPKPSKADSIALGFTKFNNKTIARVILNRSGYVLNINDEGEVLGCELINSLLDINSYPDASYENTNLLTNGDFTGYFSRQRFITDLDNANDSTVSVKVVLEDPCDGDLSTKILSYNVTGLESGRHNIIFDFNSSTGEGKLLVDGIVRDSFEENGTIFYIEDRLPPMLIGADSGNFRAKQEELGLSNTQFFTGTIESLIIADTVQQQQFNNRDLTNITFEFATQNPLSYKERVNKFFLFRPAIMKSSQFDLNITNTGVTETSVQAKIESDIRHEVMDKSPAHTNLQKINWKQECRFKDISLENIPPVQKF